MKRNEQTLDDLVANYKNLMKEADIYLDNTQINLITRESKAKIYLKRSLTLVGEIALKDPNVVPSLTSEYISVRLKIGTFSEGEGRIMKEATKKYFSRLLSCSQDDITFTPKGSGVQKGAIVMINEMPMYYLKTHQGGSTTSEQSFRNTDPKELLVYKILEDLRIGSETHFIISEEKEKSLYIATKNCACDGDFVLASKVIESRRMDISQDYLICFNVCDAISRILVLKDTTPNSTNFGFLSRGGRVYPKIIDFRTETEDSYLEEEIVKSFKSGNTRFNYNYSYNLVRLAITEQDTEQRLQNVRNFFGANIPNFEEIVTRNFEIISKKLHELKTHLGLGRYEENFRRYMEDIVRNFRLFMTI
jgi:hypothetical protein